MKELRPHESEQLQRENRELMSRVARMEVLMGAQIEEAIAWSADIACVNQDGSDTLKNIQRNLAQLVLRSSLCLPNVDAEKFGAILRRFEPRDSMWVAITMHYTTFRQLATIENKLVFANVIDEYLREVRVMPR